MGLALLAGFRLATQIRSSITALQTASELQTYPGVIAQQLTALRERLETREIRRRAPRPASTANTATDTHREASAASLVTRGPSRSARRPDDGLGR